MLLSDEPTPCAICGCEIPHPADGTIFPEFCEDWAPPLVQEFTCTVVHAGCYAAWPLRLDYARALVASRIQAGGSLVYDDDLVAVVVKLTRWHDKPTNEWNAAVHVYEMGTETIVSRGEWEHWVAAEELPEHDALGFKRRGFPFEQAALDRARARLRAVLPSRRCVEDRVDWASARAEANADWERNNNERERERHILECCRDAWEGTRAAVVAGTFACPHCGGHDLRVIDRGPAEKSYFVCRGCHRSHMPQAR